MKNLCPLIALTLSVAGCSPSGEPVTESDAVTSSNSADAVYTNGKIYTVDDGNAWAEAVAVKDGKFLAVGSESDVQAVTGDTTRVVDLEGRMMMPGLIDSHNHVIQIPVDRAHLNFSDPTDSDSMLAEVAAYAKANPDAPYIRGGTWNLGVFPNNSPRKELLDAIDSERPIYMFSQTGHSAWVNSAAIELIGLANLEQDSRHIWDVDPDTGEPSGTIREWTMSLLEQELEPTEAERLAPELAELVAQFSEYGFTSLKDAGSEVWHVQSANLLDERRELNIRMFPSWFHQAHFSASTEERSRQVAADWESYVSPHVYPRYVKMVADGSSASATSLLLDDYVGRPGFKGSMAFPYEKYAEDFVHYNSLGLGMIVHVYGDGTSEKIIEAFEEVRRRNGDNGIPLHFSHAFMTTPDQIKRLAKISDVSIDFMTLQYPHDSVSGNFMPSIGEERYQRWLNTRSAVEVGIPYGFGSDWPAAVEPILNGFFQMQGFVTREDPNNSNSGTLNADQAITLEQAVYGFTQGGAYNLGFDWPEKVGSIEEGKLADFIVIDRNIFEIPIETLKDTQVEMTVVGGRVVFERE
jgi:hypothetical protein